MSARLIKLVNRLFPSNGYVSSQQKLAQSLTCGFIGGLGKTYMRRHTVNIYNKESLTKLIYHRPENCALLTICNHACNMDDFLLWTHILSHKDLFNSKLIRWVAIAEDICFKNSFYAYFFAYGKTVPLTRNLRDRDTGELISRGLGVFQPSMQFLLSQLNQGNWVNFFPQGRVIYGDELGTDDQIRFKWGIGRLITDAEKLPVILPMWQCGLESINTMRRPYIIGLISSLIFGRKVTICVGEPIQMESYLKHLRSTTDNPREIHRLVTAKVQEKMMLLRQYTEKMHNKALDHS